MSGEAVPVEGGGGYAGEDAEAADAGRKVAQEDSDVAEWRETGDLAGKNVLPTKLDAIVLAAFVPAVSAKRHPHFSFFS